MDTSLVIPPLVNHIVTGFAAFLMNVSIIEYDSQVQTLAKILTCKAPNNIILYETQNDYQFSYLILKLSNLLAGLYDLLKIKYIKV